MGHCGRDAVTGSSAVPPVCRLHSVVAMMSSFMVQNSDVFMVQNLVFMVQNAKSSFMVQNLNNNNNNNNDNNNYNYNERISRALFHVKHASNRCKYKNRKRMHIRHLKTVDVQTIMLKHPVKHIKKNTHKTNIPHKCTTSNSKWYKI